MGDETQQLEFARLIREEGWNVRERNVEVAIFNLRLKKALDYVGEYTINKKD
ncbi:MAG: hypothetical protein U0930_24480 [Pirellulales bacterium]